MNKEKDLALRMKLHEIIGGNSTGRMVEQIVELIKGGEQPSASWISVTDDLPPENTIVWGHSPEWIDEDFNPEGVRECHYNDGDWNSAKWVNSADDYVNDATWKKSEKGTPPTHWMQLPQPPKQRKGEQPTASLPHKLQQLRNELYEAIPTKDVTEWALLKVIKNHIKRLDELTAVAPAPQAQGEQPSASLSKGGADKASVFFFIFDTLNNWVNSHEKERLPRSAFHEVAETATAKILEWGAQQAEQPSASPLSEKDIAIKADNMWFVHESRMGSLFPKFDNPTAQRKWDYTMGYKDAMMVETPQGEQPTASLPTDEQLADWVMDGYPLTDKNLERMRVAKVVRDRIAEMQAHTPQQGEQPTASLPETEEDAKISDWENKHEL